MTVHREAGALADEAALLVEAALGWVQRAAGAIDPTGERFATGAPECSACPLCRTVGALRDPSPELTERLTHTVSEVASVVAAGLRTAFDGRGRYGHSGHPGQPGHTGHAGHQDHHDHHHAWAAASQPDPADHANGDGPADPAGHAPPEAPLEHGAPTSESAEASGVHPPHQREGDRAPAADAGAPAAASADSARQGQSGARGKHRPAGGGVEHIDID